jgi:hypothetical protein
MELLADKSTSKSDLLNSLNEIYPVELQEEIGIVGGIFIRLCVSEDFMLTL